MGLSNSYNESKNDDNIYEYRKMETRVVDAAKVPLSLINYVSKSICKLSYKKNYEEFSGTGFFMSINKHKCLLTNYHNIPKDFINTDIKIELYEKGMIKIKKIKK